jgi:hypothetical protein
MAGQEQLHNPKSRFRSHRREHIRVPGHLLYGFLPLSRGHMSIFAETSMLSGERFRAKP